jgi:raffinose/stachyose/melibiose transport system permease protein
VTTDTAEAAPPARRAFRGHIVVFLLPAVVVYTAVMIYPLIETLRLSLFSVVDGHSQFVGL